MMLAGTCVEVDVTDSETAAPRPGAAVVLRGGALAARGAALASIRRRRRDGAGAGRVTVPGDGVQPATSFGFTLSDESVGVDGRAPDAASSRTNTSRLPFTRPAT